MEVSEQWLKDQNRLVNVSYFAAATMFGVLVLLVAVKVIKLVASFILPKGKKGKKGKSKKASKSSKKTSKSSKKGKKKSVGSSKSSKTKSSSIKKKRSSAKSGKSIGSESLKLPSSESSKLSAMTSSLPSEPRKSGWKKEIKEEPLGKIEKPKEPSVAQVAEEARAKFHKLDVKQKVHVAPHLSHPNTICERNLHKDKKSSKEEGVKDLPKSGSEEKHVKIFADSSHNTQTTGKFEAAQSKWPSSSDPISTESFSQFKKETDVSVGSTCTPISCLSEKCLELSKSPMDKPTSNVSTAAEPSPTTPGPP
ncbi:unnamed protein product [Bursaphelenchus xylophilus]|uniref:(pine wood nematode) hypothetical protein n=1 Tax=Bursaphelenchus xylophilus TaxID=6326 RepID=A0A1I7SRN9_BURXY|nr:unnamed protein product [Bursaphelenchus xylophilus]CAG9102059.1 unnamed protein product [Bursaphelenchus xylophilus]